MSSSSSSSSESDDPGRLDGQDPQQQQQHQHGWEGAQFKDEAPPSWEGGEGESSRPTNEKEGGSFWGWGGGQGLGVNKFDEEKKQKALAACAAEHEALINCLGKGAFVTCSSLQKAFWDCYAKHRGVRGNKVAAWVAAPSLSGKRG